MGSPGRWTGRSDDVSPAWPRLASVSVAAPGCPLARPIGVNHAGTCAGCGKEDEYCCYEGEDYAIMAACNSGLTCTYSQQAYGYTCVWCALSSAFVSAWLLLSEHSVTPARLCAFASPNNPTLPLKEIWCHGGGCRSQSTRHRSHTLNCAARGRALTASVAVQSGTLAHVLCWLSRSR